MTLSRQICSWIFVASIRSLRTTYENGTFLRGYITDFFLGYIHKHLLILCKPSDISEHLFTIICTSLY